MLAFIQNQRGVLAILAAMLLFVSNDAAMKLAGHTLPLTQTLFLRGSFAALLSLGAVLLNGQLRHLNGMWHPLVAFRSVLEILGSFMFQAAILHMPIGDATAIVQTVPLMLLAFAAFVLREPIGFGRVAAVLAGFAGALLVAAPSGNVSPAAGLAFGTALVVITRDLLSRHIGFSISPLIVTLASNLAVALTALATMGLGPAWVVPNPTGWALTFAAGACIAAAYVLMTLALIWSQVQKLAPFYYSQTLYAVSYSLLLFGDMPGWQVLVGIGLILIAGGYTALPGRKHRPVLTPTAAP